MHCLLFLQPGLAGITSMLVRKAHRHEAAWQQYCASRDVARQQHDTAAAMAAAVLKAALDGVSGDVEQQMSVLAEDKVMLLSEQQILQVSREQLPAVAVCPASTSQHILARAFHPMDAAHQMHTNSPCGVP
jgi:hypothetical protein